MALRQLAARCSLLRSSVPGLSRPASSAPSVYDKLVTFTLVDKLGRRHTLRGLEGQTVVDVLQENTETLGDDMLCLSPDGRDRMEAHVKLPNELASVIPPHVGDTARELQQIAPEDAIDEHSRLGSSVVLSKALDGTLLAISTIQPWRSA